NRRAGANPSRGHWLPSAVPRVSEGTATGMRKGASWRPNPTQAGMENPTAVVIRQPAPRLTADESPASERWVEIPLTHLKRIPTKRNAIRPPAITEAVNGIPSAVSIEITETGGVIVNAG